MNGRLPSRGIAYVAGRALPLMDPAARAEAEGLIAELTANSEDETEIQKATEAFHDDMRPVREAIVSALEAGDMEALRGLRALLPHLLAEVNRSPALADLLAHELGKSLLAGLNAKPEEAL